MDDGHDGGTSELPLMVGAMAGEPEVLMLIGVPVDDEVLVRQWTSDAWSAAPASRVERSDALLAWIEAQAARGRSLNQSLYALRLWLRDADAARAAR